MTSRPHNSPNLIYSVGTQVVSLKQVQASSGQAAHPAGRQVSSGVRPSITIYEAASHDSPF